jgi:hypothetical protein
MTDFDGSVPFALRDRLPELSGLYFIYEADTLCYIGKSINLRERLRYNGHHNFKAFSSLSSPIIKYILLSPDALEDAELSLIEKYSPNLNRKAAPVSIGSGITSLGASVPKEVKAAFLLAVDDRNTTLSILFREVITEWLERNGYLEANPPKPGPKAG